MKREMLMELGVRGLGRWLPGKSKKSAKQEHG